MYYSSAKYYYLGDIILLHIKFTANWTISRQLVAVRYMYLMLHLPTILDF